jgi:predicted transporter
MIFSAILFVGAAMFVIGYALWEARRVSRLTLTEASSIGVAAIIVLLLFLLLFFRTLHYVDTATSNQIAAADVEPACYFVSRD